MKPKLAYLFCLCLVLLAATTISAEIKIGSQHKKKFNPSSSNGAIITLIKSNKKFAEFHDLINRHKSIQKYLLHTSMSAKIEQDLQVIIFHEADLPYEIQNYIQAQTPALQLKFTVVDFKGHAVYNDPTNTTIKLVDKRCFETKLSKFGMGYHNMCRFWFIGFLEYVKQYDWVYRLDDDCALIDFLSTKMYENILPIAPNKEFHNIPVPFIAASVWLPLYRYMTSDGVNSTYDGDVVKGLGSFVREFAINHQVSLDRKIDSFIAPYSNAMYINTKWLFGGSKDANLVLDFVKAVDASNCIYSNRWGDLPLWGAALSLIDHPVFFMNASYSHGSHKRNISIKSTANRGQGNYLLYFGEHLNAVAINTRVTVVHNS